MKASIRAEERSKRGSALEKALTDLQAMKTQAPANLPELDEQLRAAELELKSATDKAMAALRESGNPASQRILEGAQSLVLDAKTGRRALSHALPGIDAMTDGSSVSWQVHLVQDGHTNLQLGLDIAQGLTAGLLRSKAATSRRMDRADSRKQSSDDTTPRRGQRRSPSRWCWI